MNLIVPTALHRRFKAMTSSKGISMTDVLLEFIEQYVKKHPTAGQKKGGR